MMVDVMHAAAPHHLPWFIVHPGQSDVLMTASAVFLIILIFCAGVIYFSLHNLPERFAHRSSKLQFEVVAVLSLLALFTHIYAFWIAALLLAIIPIPDFWTPLSSMASSLHRLAYGRGYPAALDPADDAPPPSNTRPGVTEPREHS